MLVNTEGFVLKNRKYGETDSLLTLFTRKLGKINALAKGARRPKSALLAGIQSFGYSEFVLYKGKGMYTVSQCDLKKNFYGIHQDLDRLTYGSYLLELIDGVTQEGQPYNRLFKLLETCLEQMTEEEVHIKNIARAFELKLLAFSGLRPQLGACVVCGTETTEPQGFSLAEGGILCANCYPQAIQKQQVSPTLVRLAGYFLYREIAETSRIKINPKLMEALTLLNRQYLAYHLGLNKFKSLEMMEKM